jgi:hypothetical protein
MLLELLLRLVANVAVGNSRAFGYTANYRFIKYTTETQLLDEIEFLYIRTYAKNHFLHSL